MDARVAKPATQAADLADADRRRHLAALERKVLWLATWMIHHANHERPRSDNLKVGGHQASSASVVTLMTALYFDVLRGGDRVAVKPHASPVFHAIQYLMGRQSRANLENFRALGGAQSYPSRTKDAGGVDFSTGSVGLGVGVTAFAALTQDYLRAKALMPAAEAPGRMIAIVGDAELDEGNIFEAVFESWKHDLRNLWWIIDYNRQSLDSVIPRRLTNRLGDIFASFGWNVITLKYGKKLEAAFAGPGGGALRRWIDECPNALYSALTFKAGGGWREHLRRDLGDTSGIKTLLDSHDDATLRELMTNLAGHDSDAVREAFHGVDGDAPHCFIAYTIKGFGLPLAGHKDNHAGLLSPDQVAEFRAGLGIAPGEEWDKFAGLDIAADALAAFIEATPFAGAAKREFDAAPVAVPARIDPPAGTSLSTQDAFGRILNEIGRGDDAFAARIVTTSPDVTVSTNLGPWVNRRGVFDRHDDTESVSGADVVSAQRWVLSPAGQHIELGIAENNLFLLLAALGLSGPLFGTRLLPIGTLYDPFIERGLDALNYACYQDARFMLVGTPSGITLAPEGGAHQSVVTPLIGLGQAGLVAFEPAFADELALIMRWGFSHMQEDDGGAVYLRLTTRALDQPERDIGAGLESDILAGAYWLVPPAPGAELVIVYSGAVAPEAVAAHAAILDDVPGAGLLAVTSADRLHSDWLKPRRGTSHIESLLAPLSSDAGLVTVIDGHPATLSWLGSLGRYRVHPLGVTGFGQSGGISDLYRIHGIDAGAILDACAAACLQRIG